MSNAIDARAVPTFRSTPAMDSFMEPMVTRHARARMQQRGIARSHVDFLLEFGREYHDHRGAVVVVLDRSATRRIARSGAASGVQLDALRGLYAVIGNGSIRTVGRRTRRLRRH
jgi:hypothetical protein